MSIITISSCWWLKPACSSIFRQALRDGIFYLAVVVEVPEPSKSDAVGTLGIDLGIVYLATDNDGETFQ